MIVLCIVTSEAVKRIKFFKVIY